MQLQIFFARCGNEAIRLPLSSPSLCDGDLNLDRPDHVLINKRIRLLWDHISWLFLLAAFYCDQTYTINTVHQWFHAQFSKIWPFISPFNTLLLFAWRHLLILPCFHLPGNLRFGIQIGQFCNGTSFDHSNTRPVLLRSPLYILFFKNWSQILRCSVLRIA